MGTSFNINLGLLYQDNKDLELELGFKYKFIVSESNTMNISNSPVTVNFEEDLNIMYIGLNYKF